MRHSILAATLLLTPLALAPAPALAGGEEEELELDDCPKAVRDAIRAAANGGKIKEVEKETKNGKTTYEAEVLVDGKEVEIKVAEDGTVLSRKVEEEDDDDDDDDD